VDHGWHSGTTPVRVINAHGAAVKRYTPAVSRVAAFRATIRRSYIAKYNFVLPRMEMLYSGAYDLSRKNRTHTGARAARACVRVRALAWSISRWFAAILSRCPARRESMMTISLGEREKGRE
jgi:hypothetical protein